MAGSSSSADFARQLAAHNAPATNPAKRFRSSAAPKGSKLASGYVDRTQTRVSAEDDEMAGRVKALEEMVKLGQIDEGTFVRLRNEILGGDVSTTHLVKGLDWKLLERVRKGVDVLAGGEMTVEDKDGEERVDDGKVEEEFQKLEQQEVQPVEKEEKSKKGETASPSVVAGKKRTRDEILAELRASRLAAAAEQKAAEKPSLGPKFRKLGDTKARSRIERDEKGREVLITVDDEGNVKRKVKKVRDQEHIKSNGSALLVPDKDAKPLGMEVQAIPPPAAVEDDDDGDIFEGAGDDYNPLGATGNDDDDDDVSSSEGSHTPRIDGETASAQEGSKVGMEQGVAKPLTSPHIDDTSRMPPPPPSAKAQVAPRNYFGDTGPTNADIDATTSTNPLKDPTILAALKKASYIAPITSEESRDANDEESARIARRKRLLDSHDRDADDMDLGFGSSRFGDEEDMEDRKVKLSVWRGQGEDAEDGVGRGEGKGKRKRGNKKRKGDGNNAADVLKVLERRKEEGKK